MKKIIALTLTTLLTLQLLTFNTSLAASAYESINACVSISEVLSLLKASAVLTELGLIDYSVLFTKAFSKIEKEVIATAVFNNGTDYTSNTEVANSFKNALATVITPQNRSGSEIVMFDSFDQTYTNGLINGCAPAVGTGTWSRVGTSATTSIVSTEKALLGNQSFKTRGENVPITTTYATTADSYTMTYYVYDNFTVNGKSNITFDINGASHAFIGLDLSNAYNQNWQGRSGIIGNKNAKTAAGTDMLRTKGWNKLVYNVDAIKGTKLFINGEEVYWATDNQFPNIKTTTGLMIAQRSGWFAGTVINNVYTDAVSIVKYAAPVISEATITQAATSDGTFTVNIGNYTDPTNQDATYTVNWYVKDVSQDNSAYTLLATEQSLQYTPFFAHKGKQFKAEITALNKYGIQSNTVSANIIESAMVDVPAVYSQIRNQYKDFLVAGGADLNNEGYKTKVAQLDASMNLWLSQDIFMPSSNAARTTLFTDMPLTAGTINFHCMNTFYRLAEMAKIVKTEGSVYYNDKYATSEIIKGLEFLYNGWYHESLLPYYYTQGLYVVAGIQHTDWAMIEFHIPKAITDICVLFYDEMTLSNTNLFIHLMSTIDTFTPNYNRATGGVDGSNGTAISWAVMMRAVLLNNPAPYKFEGAASFFADLIRYTNNNNGFNEFDDSCPYHGNVPYTMGYGLGHFRDSATFLYIMRNTDYDFFIDKKDMILRWLYYSYSPLIYKSNAMTMVTGRFLGTPGSTEQSTTVSFLNTAAIVYDMLEGDEKENLAALIKYHTQKLKDNYGDLFKNTSTLKAYNIINGILNDDTVKDYTQDYSKVYPRMARVVHFRPDYGVGLAMFSKDANMTEIGPENRKGWHQGAGVVYVYTDDIQQYSNAYSPTVDAMRLPGTTIENGSTTGNGQTNKSNIANGALLDNRYTAVAFQYNKPNTGITLVANKSYFMFDKEIVCIGSEISSTSNRAVETTIDNRMLADDNSNVITVNGAQIGATAQEGKEISWVHMGGKTQGADMGYYFPGNQTVNLLRETRTGKWTDISIQDGVSSAPIIKNYLTMYESHGTNPTDGSYKYIMLPTMSLEKTSEYAQNPKVIIINDDNGIHAVKQTELNITAANFYNAVGGVTSDGFIASNKPSSVMIREDDNAYYVSIADVARESTEIKVTLPITNVIGTCVSNGIKVIKNQNNIELYADTSDKVGLSKTITLAKTSYGMSSTGVFYDFENGKNPITVEKGVNNINMSIENMPSTTKKAVKLTSTPKAADLTTFENNNYNGFTVFGSGSNGVIASSPPEGRTGSAYKTAIAKPSAIQKTVSNPQKIEMYIYDPGAGTKLNTMIIPQGNGAVFFGIMASQYPAMENTYAYRVGATCYSTGIPRKQGWVKLSYEFKGATEKPILMVDDAIVDLSARSVSDFPSSITSVIIGDNWGASVAVNGYIDDVKITYKSDIDISASYNTPFETAQETIYSADIYTDYSGDTAVYPFVVDDNQGNAILKAGFKNGNVVVGANNEIVAQAATGQVINFKAIVNTALNKVEFFIDDQSVFVDNAITALWTSDLKTEISVENVQIYITNISISAGKSPIITASNSNGKILYNLDAETGLVSFKIHSPYYQDANIIFAIYKDGALVRIETQPITSSLDITKTINKLMEGNYTVKVLVWDNQTLRPITNASLIN